MGLCPRTSVVAATLIAACSAAARAEPPTLDEIVAAVRERERRTFPLHVVYEEICGLGPSPVERSIWIREEDVLYVTRRPGATFAWAARGDCVVTADREGRDGPWNGEVRVESSSKQARGMPPLLLGPRALPLSRELERLRDAAGPQDFASGVVGFPGRPALEYQLDAARGYLPILVRLADVPPIHFRGADGVTREYPGDDHALQATSIEEVEPGVFLPTELESDGGPPVDGSRWTLKSWDHAALRAATHPAGLFDGVGQLRDPSRPGVVVRFDDGEVWEASKNFLDVLAGHRWPRPLWLRAPALAAYAAVLVAATAWLVKRRRRTTPGPAA